jgi:hypothetical protein
MTELLRLDLTKNDLNRIPPDERFFFLMAGHLANNVSILAKLFLAAFNTGFTETGQRREGPYGHAGITQTFLLLGLLAGRLHEANKLIGAHYFGKGLHKKYEAEMLAKSVDALHRFTAYFSRKSNLITPLRNHFAFHFSTEEVENVYNAAANNFPLTQYLSSEYHGYNLFYGSEMIIVNAMATLVEGCPTATEAIDRIHRDTSDATEWLGLFVFGFIQLTMKRHIFPVRRNQTENITLEDSSSISSYTLPFFVAPPDLSGAEVARGGREAAPR